MAAFIGREKEISLLRGILAKPSASVMVYGKRKVGKTTLLMHALKESEDPTVYYECLKSTMKENVDGFAKALAAAKVIPVILPFASFTDVFAYLNTLGKTLNIVIDEYPYLKEIEKAEAVDSLFQSIIDNHLSNIRLFLSGSHIGMMKESLDEKNALYGRFTLTLRLGELSYREAAEFYPDKPVYEKIALWSVFGGSPFINGFIDPEKDLKSNIVSSVLNPYCPVFTYAEHLLISNYANPVNAERIMFAISNGSKKYGEIESMLGLKNNGLLSKQITSLLNMEILAKRFPINKANDKKKISYELCDNLLRFYYAFVYRNKSALQVLGAGAFYDEYIEKPLQTFIAHRFEELCREYFSMLIQSGKLRGITNVGTYWYDDPESRTNGEFDVVLQRRGAYDIYEVKYHSAPMPEKEVVAEAGKIEKIKGLTPGRIGFISASGFDERTGEYDYIDGNELYGG